MSGFIRKCFLYFGLLFLIGSTLFVLVTVYFSKHPFRFQYRTVFLGDSRVQYLYYNKQNLAYNSESFYFNFLKIKSLNKHKHLDTVYLGCSHHSFSAYFDNYAVNQQEILPRYYILEENKWAYLKKFNFINLHFLFKKQFQLGWESMFYGKNFIPGGCASPMNRVVDINKLKKRIQQQFYYQNQTMPFSANQLRYFDSIQHFCAVNQTALILINSPVHPEYRKNVPKKYLDKYLQKTQNLRVLDMGDFLSQNTDFMPDGDHISWKAYLKCTHFINQKRHEFSKK